MEIHNLYHTAILWIAENDEPGAEWAYDIKLVSEMISIQLIADLFNKGDCEQTAKEIIQVRKRNDRYNKSYL